MRELERAVGRATMPMPARPGPTANLARMSTSVLALPRAITLERDERATWSSGCSAC